MKKRLSQNGYGVVESYSEIVDWRTQQKERETNYVDLQNGAGVQAKEL